MFTHLTVELESAAFGEYLCADVGIKVDVSRDDPPDLTAIEEVSIDGGPWLTWRELQDRHGRSVAVAIAEAIDARCADDPDLWDRFLEELADRAVAEAEDAAWSRWEDRRDG